jgi:hypothetical protein
MCINSTLSNQTSAQRHYAFFQIYILEGCHNALLGEPIPQVGDVPKENPFSQPTQRAFNEEGEAQPSRFKF